MNSPGPATPLPPKSFSGRVKATAALADPSRYGRSDRSAAGRWFWEIDRVLLLMIAVGFSAGTGEGLWAIFVYFFVQNVDGYIVVPYIARRTVDLAPAVVLAAQLIFGALFGVLGLLLADPIIAATKVTLEELSKRRAGPGGGEAA